MEEAPPVLHVSKVFHVFYICHGPKVHVFKCDLTVWQGGQSGGGALQPGGGPHETPGQEDPQCPQEEEGGQVRWGGWRDLAS